MNPRWLDLFESLYYTAEFDADYYEKAYPDVRLTGMPALEHYSKFGVLLGRRMNASTPALNYSPPIDISTSRSSKVIPANPLLTIICTTHNHERYIAQTLDGFAAQITNFDFVVLISDDCSTDSTAEIIRDFSARYDFIEYIQRPSNIGSMRNLVDLANRVSTKYVAICEGDDYWTDPHKLQLQVDFLEENPSYSICFHPVEVIYEMEPDRKETFPKVSNSEFTCNKLSRGNFIQTNSVVYRWRFHDGLPPEFESVHPGDWYLHLLHASYGRIGFIDKLMAVYRKHSLGMWSDADVDTPRLHLKYGAGELRMFEAVKQRFGGKYSEYMQECKKYVVGEVFSKLLLADKFESLADFIHDCQPLRADVLGLIGIDTAEPDLNRGQIEALLKKHLSISVIVTAYNHSDTLRRCLDSILMQKGAISFEIIIGDDCSTDSSQLIIDEYLQKHPSIIKQVRSPANVGMLSNMQRCIRNATAPFIAVCEGDDYWISEYKLAKQTAFLCLNNDCSMVFNWVLLSEEKGEKLVPHVGQGLLDVSKISFTGLLAEPITANFSACMYRASVVEAIPESYFNQSNAADWLFNLHVAERGCVGFIKELLSVYRVHGKGQWSGLTSREQAARVLEVKREFAEIFGLNPHGVGKRLSVKLEDARSDYKEIFGFCLDTPTSDSTWLPGINQIELSGWAVGALGAPVDILLHIDGEIRVYETTVKRTDVVDYFKNRVDIPVLDVRCGFHILVPAKTYDAIRIGLRHQGKSVWFKTLTIQST